jgi:hypothetical protein
MASQIPVATPVATPVPTPVPTVSANTTVTANTTDVKKESEDVKKSSETSEMKRTPPPGNIITIPPKAVPNPQRPKAQPTWAVALGNGWEGYENVPQIKYKGQSDRPASNVFN